MSETDFFFYTSKSSIQSLKLKHVYSLEHCVRREESFLANYCHAITNSPIDARKLVKIFIMRPTITVVQTIEFSSHITG